MNGSALKWKKISGTTLPGSDLSYGLNTEKAAIISQMPITDYVLTSLFLFLPSHQPNKKRNSKDTSFSESF